jgi:hypothetical protein
MQPVDSCGLVQSPSVVTGVLLPQFATCKVLQAERGPSAVKRQTGSKGTETKKRIYLKWDFCETLDRESFRQDSLAKIDIVLFEGETELPRMLTKAIARVSMKFQESGCQSTCEDCCKIGT